jgi:hypothetical protein
VASSLEITPAGGAIGTACDVPETASISNVAATTAKAVRIISILLVLSSGANLCQRLTRQNDRGSADQFVFIVMNG